MTLTSGIIVAIKKANKIGDINSLIKPIAYGDTPTINAKNNIKITQEMYTNNNILTV